MHDTVTVLRPQRDSSGAMVLLERLNCYHRLLACMMRQSNHDRVVITRPPRHPVRFLAIIEEDFEQVATFFHRGVTIAQKVAADTGKIKAYREALADGGSHYPEIAQLKEDVVTFCRGFPVIGFDDETMRYPA